MKLKRHTTRVGPLCAKTNDDSTSEESFGRKMCKIQCYARPARVAIRKYARPTIKSSELRTVTVVVYT